VQHDFVVAGFGVGGVIIEVCAAILAAMYLQASNDLIVSCQLGLPGWDDAGLAPASQPGRVPCRPSLLCAVPTCRGQVAQAQAPHADWCRACVWCITCRVYPASTRSLDRTMLR